MRFISQIFLLVYGLFTVNRTTINESFYCTNIIFVVLSILSLLYVYSHIKRANSAYGAPIGTSFHLECVVKQVIEMINTKC